MLVPFGLFWATIMKLIKEHITNFRSAEDSEPFSVDQVTCLVGKNEAGKSVVLLALAALNPHPSTPAVLEKEGDYPRRHLTAYSERHPSEECDCCFHGMGVIDLRVGTGGKGAWDGVIKGPVVTFFNVTTYETFSAKLQSASNNITDQILEYWPQNPDLMVRVDVSSAKPDDKPPFCHPCISNSDKRNCLRSPMA
jgi:hypothetical protein